MSCWVPATGIRTKLPLARLKPAVGEESRQAPPKPRAGDKRPSCSDFQIHNPGKVRERQQMIGLRLGVHFVSTKWQMEQGLEGSAIGLAGYASSVRKVVVTR